MTVQKAVVASRVVFLVQGPRTQTINVCDANNRRGQYDWIVRIPGPKFIARDDLSRFATVEEMVEWLKEQGGLIEQSPADLAVLAKSESGPLLQSASFFPGPPNPPDDPWLERARVLVERAIDDLVLQFLEFPYLHRVEHSLHAELFMSLTRHRHFSQTFPLCTGEVTQTVHKEWPETQARPDQDGRGNFDLALITPSQIASATLFDLKGGHIQAPIAVEIGLDYPFVHLAGDEEKLVNSNVAHGYLVHLTRNMAVDHRVEEIILDPKGGGQIRTAYASINATCRFRKLIADSEISKA